MIKNGRPYTNENGFVDEALITEHSDEEIAAVDGWIRKNVRLILLKAKGMTLSMEIFVCPISL